MPPFLTGLTAKLIAIGIVALAFIGLGTALYIEHLRLTDADDKLSAIDSAADVCAGKDASGMTTQAKVQSCITQRDQAVAANADFKAKLDAVTADAAAAEARAAQAAQQAKTIQANAASKIAAIEKDAKHAASQSDDAPVSPGLAAAIVGLRQQFGAGAVADRH